jgi:hypothetical protein
MGCWLFNNTFVFESLQNRQSNPCLCNIGATEHACITIQVLVNHTQFGALVSLSPILPVVKYLV